MLIRFPKIYKPNRKDIGAMLEIDRGNIKEILAYAMSAFDRVSNGINRCDNKAIFTITIVVSLSGALYLLIKDNAGDIKIIKFIYALNLILVLMSVLLSLWSLVVKSHKIPPSIGDIILWVKDESTDGLNDRIIPSLIYGISVAEENYMRLLERKVNLLKLSQIIGFLSITCIFISMMVIKIFLN